jgi:hypothetical protein
MKQLFSIILLFTTGFSLLSCGPSRSPIQAKSVEELPPLSSFEKDRTSTRTIKFNGINSKILMRFSQINYGLVQIDDPNITNRQEAEAEALDLVKRFQCEKITKAKQGGVAFDPTFTPVIEDANNVYTFRVMCVD